jgi:hypothetical protein
LGRRRRHDRRPPRQGGVTNGGSDDRWFDDGGVTTANCVTSACVTTGGETTGVARVGGCNDRWPRHGGLRRGASRRVASRRWVETGGRREGARGNGRGGSARESSRVAGGLRARRVLPDGRPSFRTASIRINQIRMECSASALERWRRPRTAPIRWPPTTLRSIRARGVHGTDLHRAAGDRTCARLGRSGRMFSGLSLVRGVPDDDVARGGRSQVSRATT